MDEQPISTNSPKSGDNPLNPNGSSSLSPESTDDPLCFSTKPQMSPQASSSMEVDSVSGVSLKSDMSMDKPVVFGKENPQRLQTEDETSSLSVFSMDSRRSKDKPEVFRKEMSKRLTFEAEASSVSGVSMDSRRSKDKPEVFRKETSKRKRTPEDSRDSRDSRKKPKRDPEGTGEDTGRRTLLKTKQKLQTEMQKRFSRTSEGLDDKESSLKSIYTEVLISTAETEGPHEEHTFRHIRRKQASKHVVNLGEIFRQETDRVVLTKGIAGIGKSFTVQKVTLDWAEGTNNQDFDLVFVIAFRELNLTEDEKSLEKLLTDFHPALQGTEDLEVYTQAKVLVILDGLDESRLQLDFEDMTVVSTVREVSSVGNLLTNLITRNLLPEAKVWITSRPAAANQIPAKFIDMVTEIRGFTDPQKEEYFTKRFPEDPGLAQRIISHIRSSQTLDIMCQIPIFCWMCAVLFQETFSGDQEAEVPQTLTEMMACFIVSQTKRRNTKYEEKTERNKENLLKNHRMFLLKLGKVAFVQLQKNHIIFYEEDLEDCQVDIKEATIYSGFCNAVLREDDIFSNRKIFFFVHLTIQEFFAALFVFDCFTRGKHQELGEFLNMKNPQPSLLDLLKATIDKVLEEKNGHLDFFLRFLLGLMVGPNRKVLQGLLATPDSSQDTEKKILVHLKSIHRKNLSPDQSINLFQTMVEMRDNDVKDEIQDYLNSSTRSKTALSSLHCSALAYMLQVSERVLERLDLKRFNTTDEGRRRLIPAVRTSRRALLADCKVTPEWIEHLAFGLRFPYSPLRDLDLNTNDLGDSGVELLCAGLSSPLCKLKTLSLSGCQVTEKGCEHLASALRSNPSHLKKLDLSYNNPGDAGEKLLSDLKEDQRYKLIKVSFDHCGIERMKPRFKKYATELTFDPNTAHRNLRLSVDNRTVTWTEEEQRHDDHQDRFDHFPQVLCAQALDERHYFELDVSEPFTFGLTYRSIGRKGAANDCRLDSNDKSWCLSCVPEGCVIVHGGESFDVPSHLCRTRVHRDGGRVGVYLDWPAGLLSFFMVHSDSLTRLNTFRKRFSEPLCPAVQLHAGSSASICQP